MLRFKFLNKVKFIINVFKHQELSLKDFFLFEQAWCIKINGEFKAYPIKELKKKSEFCDYVGGIGMAIVYLELFQSISAMDLFSKEIFSFQKYWLPAWKEKYPGTKIWRA